MAENEKPAPVRPKKVVKPKAEPKPEVKAEKETVREAKAEPKPKPEVKVDKETVREARAEPKPKPEVKADKETVRKAKELEVEEEADASSEEDARTGKDEKAEPAKAKASKATPKRKAAPKDEEGEEDEGEEGEEKEPSAKRGKSKPRPKPKLDAALKEALALRREKNAKRPAFHRQEWFRYQRLGDKWRAPQGIQSKMRRHWGTHADVVSIGYRGPKAARGLHPSGFREVMVHNAQALEGVDPAKEAVRIASSVGKRKREEIQKDARKLGIRVLNWRQY